LLVVLLERGGIEAPTFCTPCKRSPSRAIAPRTPGQYGDSSGCQESRPVPILMSKLGAGRLCRVTLQSGRAMTTAAIRAILHDRVTNLDGERIETRPTAKLDLIDEHATRSGDNDRSFPSPCRSMPGPSPWQSLNHLPRTRWVAIGAAHSLHACDFAQI